MPIKVEIDAHSGFCGGVIRAITRAEDYLSAHDGLWSLGSIVHNEAELGRLQEKGLKTVTSVGDVPEGGTMLIRAHGEPPSTYAEAEKRSLEVVDCTCPVVLRLQDNIRKAHTRVRELGGQVIIFGKVGHAEVLGLVGQTGGEALVVENMDMLHNALDKGEIKLAGPLEVFSQTTKSPEEYALICDAIRQAMDGGELIIHDTICRQVASRHSQLSSFAAGHDVVVFVSGKESSNGKVLFNLCLKVNERTYHAGCAEEVDPAWFRPGDSVGVCGATSTPKWLLEEVAKKILQLN